MPIFPPPFRPFYPYYNSRRFSPYMPHPTQPNKINVTNDNSQILNKFASDRPVLNEPESANFEHIYNNNNFKAKKNRNSSLLDNPISSIFSFLPTNIGPLTFNPDALYDSDEPLFEFFGIRLFLDDIIIICILIFLYKEEVHDQMLFVVLFLLLFT